MDRTSPQPIPVISDLSPSQPLSKNARKKLAKAARFAEQKKERRAHEKEKKKEKKRLRAEQRASGELDEEEEERQKKKARTQTGAGERKGPRESFGARIVVDLGFDEMMTENEIKSLTSQLAFTYSANRKAIRPFSSVLFTSLHGRTFTRLESISDAAYKRWIDTEWWQEGYDRLWEGSSSTAVESEAASSSPEQAQGERVEGESEEKKDTKHIPVGKKSQVQTAPKESIVYLTADADEELMVLKPDETYVIGGICDHNRYKNLCLKKAQASGIRAARLPIGTYLSELKTRKVLTVNQTFEILLKWAETQDWEEALYSVVPKRKFQAKGSGSVNGSESSEQRGGAVDGEMTRGMVQQAEQVDAEALDDEELENEVDGEVETAGNGVVVAAAKDPSTSAENGPATVMDPDDNAEVPPS